VVGRSGTMTCGIHGPTPFRPVFPCILNTRASQNHHCFALD
jgi:hypothetical protein